MHELKNRREVHTFVRAIMTHWGKTKEEIETRLSVLPSSLVVHRVFHEQGMLVYVRESGMDDGALAVAKRFADTFGFAYNRFLELQQKEQRAREAEVEASIERVRARALGMQESADIAGVAETLYDELVRLGFDPVRSSINVNDEEARISKAWSSQREFEVRRGKAAWTDEVERRFHGQSYADDMLERFKSLGREVLPQWLEMWRAGNVTHHVVARTREEAVDRESRIRRNRDMSPTIKKAYLGLFESGQWHYFFFYKHGWLSPLLTKELSDDDVNVGVRLADTFGMAYDRFLELEQKEKRARDAEVEASIERVRARALGMQESADIGEVATVLFEEMVRLGFAATRSTITICDDQTDAQRGWVGLHDPRALIEGKDLLSPLDIRATGYMHNVGATPWRTAWKEGASHHFIRWEGERLAQREKLALEQWLTESGSAVLSTPLTDEEFEQYLSLFAEGQFHYFFFYKHGWLSPILTQALSEEDIHVGERFAQVFGLAYDRFEELQQKEAQNRELAVEAALERVRGKALAMETEEDLSDISVSLYDELAGLDFQIKRLAISSSEFVNDNWFVHTGPPLRSGHNRISQDDWTEERRAGVRKERELVDLARREGRPYAHFHLTVEESQERYERIRPLSTSEEEWQVHRPRLTPEDHHRILTEKGWLSLVSEAPYTDEQIEVARRFAALFEFAYDRFLELDAKQKANRELSVEAALERVRGKALAMESEEDLTGVAISIAEELKGLEYRPQRITLSTLSQDEMLLNNCKALVDGEATDPSGVPMFRVPVAELSPSLTESLNGVKRGDRFEHFVLEGAELEDRRAWRRQVAPGTEMADGSEATYEGIFGREIDREHHYSFFYRNGWLRLVNETEISEEEIETGIRFARLFEFAHDRFRELEAKQRRAREAEVEASLERVRARALGMQESADIGEVAKLLFEEMLNLGFEAQRSAITILDEVETATHWYGERSLEIGEDGQAILSNEVGTRGGVGHLRYPRPAPELDAWRQGNVSHRFDRRTREEVFDREKGFLRTKDWSDDMWTAYLDLFEDGQFQYFFYFKQGWLCPTLTRGLDDDDVQVGERFAQIFSLAYDRYDELRQKEAQNRELAVEAALERVRGLALAMESQDDLNGVADSIFAELSGLDFDLHRTAVTIMRSESNVVKNWLASEAIVADDVERTIYIEQPTQDIFSAEAQGAEQREQEEAKARGERLYHFALDGEALERRFDELESMWNVTFREKPSSEHQYRLLFDAGHLSIIVDDELTDEQVDVGHRFARLFEYAHDRYLEIVAKDRQNQALLLEGALERVRSRALAMEGTDELHEVAGVLREEILRLGLEPQGMGIFIRDETTDVGRQFGFDEEGHPREAFGSLRHGDDHPISASIIAARDAGEPFYRHHFSDEDLAQDRQAVAEQDEPEYVDLDLLSTETYWFLYPQGSITVSFEDAIDDTAIGALIRFTEVFSFAYDRYLQIELKDQQNRQLRLDAVLERIHAQVAGMTQAEDMGQVLGLIHDGVREMGIPDAYITFGTLMDGHQMMYLLSDDEFGVEPFRRSIYRDLHLYRWDTGEKTQEEFDAWRIQEIRIRHHTEKTRQNLARQYTSGRRDLAPRSAMDVPLSYGVLGFHSMEANRFTSTQEQEIGKAFAEVMELGWARFLDFRRLEEQNRALEQANEEIQEATRLKSQFLATMSHELRTPMNAIIGFTRLVLRRGAEKLDERQRGNLEKVKASADHLLSLINDILDLSKVEAGRMDISPHTFVLKPLIEHACATVGPTLGKPSVNLEFDVENSIGEIHTDESRLRQVVINLLSNALKFTDQGEVRVAVRSEEGEGRREGGPSASSDITITVSDTGIGIAPDELENIFEQFRQVDGTSTRRHQGTGLGLAITRDLVELLGGRIGVESTVGEGSTFTIRIPSKYGEALAGEQGAGSRGDVSGRAGEPFDAPAAQATQDRERTVETALSPTSDLRPQASADDATGQRTTDHDQRLIVSIDDDPNVAVLLRQELEDDGYAVISALNADEGVALVKQHQPVAVTVDILMPGKDGWQTIAMLKEDPETRDVPIVVVSAMDNRDLGFSLGVHDYVVKPFDRDALIGALSRIDSGEVKDVLVVDDEAVACDLICEILDEGGYTTRRAHNGREALDRIREQKPDAMFLDLMMPEMDGFGVIEALRGTDAASIPIIVVTAKDLTQEEEQFLAAHVNRVVQKGTLDPDDLGVTLREAIARYGG